MCLRVYKLKNAAGFPFGKADRLYLYLHVQKLCAKWESTNTSVSSRGSVEGCWGFHIWQGDYAFGWICSIWQVCLRVGLLKDAGGSPLVKCMCLWVDLLKDAAGSQFGKCVFGWIC